MKLHAECIGTAIRIVEEEAHSRDGAARDALMLTAMRLRGMSGADRHFRSYPTDYEKKTKAGIEVLRQIIDAGINEAERKAKDTGNEHRCCMPIEEFVSRLRWAKENMVRAVESAEVWADDVEDKPAP